MKLFSCCIWIVRQKAIIGTLNKGCVLMTPKNSVKSYILKQPDITITKLGMCFMALFIKPGFHVRKIPDDQEFVVSQQL